MTGKLTPNPRKQLHIVWTSTIDDASIMIHRGNTRREYTPTPTSLARCNRLAKTMQEYHEFRMNGLNGNFARVI